MRWRWILFVLLTVFLIGISTRFRMTQEQRILNQVQNDTSVLQNNNSISYAKVKEVVDGDTVKLESGETVRYLGMDAPEIYEYDKKINKWNKTNKCYGQEALGKNKELALDKLIKLERDVSKTDKYGRSLYYVWSGKILINLELVKGGYATALTIRPDIKYGEEILAAEKEARENGRGLWKACQN